MRQKGSVPIIILILVLLGTLGYVVYLKGYPKLNIFQKTVIDPTPYPTATPQIASGQMEGWKTFRSEDLGFEFKYPINWQIISSSSTSLIISNINSDPSPNGGVPLPNQVFLNFALNHASLENYSPIKRRYEIITGVEVVEQGRYIDDNNTFGIVSLYRTDDNKALEHEKVVNQIISSLKFIDLPE